jgi:divalent metal cation (Fe/Co/Zn/Cd) transporter
VSMLFEIGSWTVAFREFRRAQEERSWLTAVRRSKDPTVFTVLFEDTAALLGLTAAFVGVALADVLDRPIFDGLASLAIGVILVITAAFLAYESQSLLTGEAAQPETRSGIARVASQTPGVVGINEILTMHFGPQDLLVALSLDFDDANLGRARRSRRRSTRAPPQDRISGSCTGLRRGEGVRRARAEKRT